MKNFWVYLFFVLLSTNPSFGAEDGMPQLDPEFWPSQVFWLTLIFLTLYITLWKIFLPKIGNSIENRKSRIVGDLNEAQKLKENAEKKLDEYNKIIEDSKKKAKKILAAGKKKLDEDLESKRVKFNSEIEKEINEVEKEINNLKKSSILGINKIAAEISGTLIREIIKSDVNASNVSAIVEDISKKRIEKYL